MISYCKICGDKLHEKRSKMGYDTCVNCSTESKWSGVPVINHKTGNEIQVVKDPKVAAEFMALSHRAGFGAFQGRSLPDINEAHDPSPFSGEAPAKIPDKVVGRKIDTSRYDDENVCIAVLETLDTQGREAAVALLEKEFQSLRISPDCRKRMLVILNPIF